MAIAPEPSIEVEIMLAKSNVLSEVMWNQVAIKSDMTTIHSAKAMRSETTAISFNGKNVMNDFIIDFRNVLTVIESMFDKYHALYI